MARRTVQAAGGAVYRLNKGEAEYLLVRRPRYKDWTLPKGKLNRGEGPQEAALREVREETGYSCRTEAEVGSIGYTLGSGRNKAVRYWLMRPEGGEFAINDEVDKIKWLNAADATSKLSYRKERAVLARAMEMVAEPNSGRVHLVRHAAAGTRSKNERDWRRSLSKKGKRQAEKLARLLAKHPVVEIRTSKFVRSVATVRPLALALAIPTVKDQRLAEGRSLEDILEVISDLAGKNAVLCSHRDMISLLMAHLDEQGIELGDEPEWRKASVWTLETIKGRVTAASYRKPPT